MARIPNRHVGGAQGAYNLQPGSTPESTNLTAGWALSFVGSESVTHQTEIEVGEKVGLPARVRAMKHDTEYARDKEKTTFIVRVEDMMELFGWLGYPVEPPRVRGPER